MNTINLTAPRKYAEMTENQVRYIATLQVSGTPEENIWTKCFIRFTGIKPIVQVKDKYFFVKKGLKGFFTLTVEEVTYFSKKMDFLTRHYVGFKPFHRVGRYVPCMPLFENVRFLQYLEAENYYQAYIFTKDEKHLHLLMATLYGRKGEKYDNHRTERRARYFKKRSAVEKMSTVMWIIGVKEYFSRKFSDLFDSAESGDSSTPPDMYEIIQNQIRILNNGDVTKREKVLNSLTWDALHEMNAKIKESKELAKQMKTT